MFRHLHCRHCEQLGKTTFKAGLQARLASTHRLPCFREGVKIQKLLQKTPRRSISNLLSRRQAVLLSRNLAHGKISPSCASCTNDTQYLQQYQEYWSARILQILSRPELSNKKLEDVFLLKSESGGDSKKNSSEGKETSADNENNNNEDDKGDDNKWSNFKLSKKTQLQIFYSSIAISFLVGYFLLDREAYEKRTQRKITFEEFVSEYLVKSRVEKLYMHQDVYSDVVFVEVDQHSSPFFIRIGTKEKFFRDLSDAEKAHFGKDGVTPFEYRYGDYRDSQLKPPKHGDNRHSSPLTLLIFLAICFALPRILRRIRSFGLQVRMSQRQMPPMMNNMMNSPVAVLTKTTGVTFKDVAGCENAKKEILEFVNFIKHKDVYQKLGAVMPRGALLTGPPGTGKTLLAKAVAGEAGVPFIFASGSDFEEIFYGVGPDRIKKMFKLAKDNAPCIIFIDEIDSLGRKRSSYKTPGMDETINQFLVELDGFGTDSRVVVLGATNRIDVLDSALTRSGRFDRKIHFSLPAVKERDEIFQVHLQPIKYEGDKAALAKEMSLRTASFSGADIANMCNEAALIAARHKKDSVTRVDFDKAFERVVVGLEKKSQILSPEEKKTVAYHEAGHAIAGWFLEHASPLIKVSIRPHGKALGYVLNFPTESFIFTENQKIDSMCVGLGGRISEEIFFGNLTSGAADDLRKVTGMAYREVMYQGASEAIGPMAAEEYNSPLRFDSNYSEDTAATIDDEAKKLVMKCYDRTRNLLAQHKEDIQKLAEALLDKEQLERADIVAMIGERPWPIPEGLEDTNNGDDDEA